MAPVAPGVAPWQLQRVPTDVAATTGALSCRHPSTIMTAADVAVVLRLLGRLPEALALQRQQLEVRVCVQVDGVCLMTCERLRGDHLCFDGMRCMC